MPRSRPVGAPHLVTVKKPPKKKLELLVLQYSKGVWR